MKTVTVDKLRFKKHLSEIEKISLKNFLFTWVGSSSKGLDDFFRLEYTEDVFAKMEKTANDTDLLISGDDYFRYITVTEDSQIVIGVLDSNSELKFRIISPDEICLLPFRIYLFVMTYCQVQTNQLGQYRLILHRRLESKRYCEENHDLRHQYPDGQE